MICLRIDDEIKKKEICDLGDKVPPHVYNDTVFRQTKNEYKAKQLRIKETDPIQSLDVLKQSSQKCFKHTISLN